ncbi:MAG: alpha/beta fold hydrolase [Anaerolineae bacterium]|nr:alpha/beta fold hydrolase [Anaerolineae bacterium]
MRIAKRFRRLLTSLGLGYLALAAWNGRTYRRVRRLDFPPPLEGDAASYDWSGGRIYYTRRGQGEPLLLVHGIYAGADSYQFRKVFAPLAGRCEVYAYDLLGFGHSARPDVRYSGPLYVRLLSDFVRNVIGRPATVIATSLSGGHAVLAADREREMIRRLVLVAPTGSTTPSIYPGGAAQAVYLALNLLPDLGEGVRNLIASRPFIRYYLRSMAYYDPENASPDLVEYSYRSAHQPGAEHALAAFLTGHLNVPVGDALRSLPQPLSLFWGRHSRVTTLAQAECYLSVRPDARLHVLERAGLDAINEQPEEFVHQVFDILEGREAGMAGEQAIAQAVPGRA